MPGDCDSLHGKRTGARNAGTHVHPCVWRVGVVCGMFVRFAARLRSFCRVWTVRGAFVSLCGYDDVVAHKLGGDPTRLGSPEGVFPETLPEGEFLSLSPSLQS